MLAYVNKLVVSALKILSHVNEEAALHESWQLPLARRAGPDQWLIHERFDRSLTGHRM